ncbi:MAG TPA: DinB family protein [Bacteroidia bacterium]|nr:DinB family protein [Bacteroidia bacterium]
MRTEPIVLADIVDKTRVLTKYFIGKLHHINLHETFSSGPYSLNSAFWIIAHIAVTQNGLLLRCTGGDAMRISWAKKFNMGSTVPEAADAPPIEEVLSVLDEVHQRSLTHIRTMDPAFLEELNPAGFEILGENTVRGMITHAIRHEASHAGQLGWLCKLHGIKSI